MDTKHYDRATAGTGDEALDFIGNILEYSTEYSVIGKLGIRARWLLITLCFPRMRGDSGWQDQALLRARGA
jgi:hypothetical protein